MYIDFSDDWGEPSEAEFQPLLDFENEILLEAPHNDITRGHALHCAALPLV
ncbi:MAG: hypothetical protein JGK33_10265 [Microcoleus sp. PH2017_11_PCY_U_A]|uniref:hypothetical protein n=1 Tax=Microcoleus sp. PH2017_11_PCY_U_A TaxID=2798822 RepID=UPI001DE51396|nr:hypothetical protein [Microcoleus sp. PH2017_11_PCY_U_A]MCC3460043.1 hypothetical protein [Microcoleus sp. PH2017_11_PCY_U_A]